VNEPNAAWFEQRAHEELTLARSTDDPVMKAAHLDQAAYFAAARERAAGSSKAA
jgi:hypothetical protein